MYQEKKNGAERAGADQPVRKFTEGMLDNDLILETLAIASGQTVLDAGCGTGYMAKLFADRVGSSGKVIALDPNSHFIRILAQETRGTVIRAMEGDITRPTGLPSRSVDLIYLATVMHIFSPQQVQGFVQEVGRLLKPGGILAVVNLDKKETPFGPPVAQRYAPEDVVAVMPLQLLKTLSVADYFYMQLFRNQGMDGRH